MSSFVRFLGGARRLLEGIIIGLEGEGVLGHRMGCHCRVGQGGGLLLPLVYRWLELLGRLGLGWFVTSWLGRQGLSRLTSLLLLM